MSRRHQQQHHQQVTGSSTLLEPDGALFGAKDGEFEQHGDVTFKDQVREDPSLATAAASAATGGGRAAAAADRHIPMVSAVAVS
jgi:hypothetical protein